jgi:SAM-dependent methyltransferase
MTGALAAAYARWRSSELGQITDALEHRLLLEMARITPGMEVLDVGCGDGVLAGMFAQAGAVVTGVDADPEMIAVARKRAFADSTSARFLLADAARLPFATSAFDLVVASALLCLVRDRRAVVVEMARALKPGGRLVIGELGAWSIWNAWRRVRGSLGATPWRDVHFHTSGELMRLLRGAGLEPDAVRGSIYYPPSAFAARLIAPFDACLGKYSPFGAAFLVASARKPDLLAAASPESYCQDAPQTDA